MSEDPRLAQLMTGVSDVLGTPVHDQNSSIGDLGIDSKYLFEIALVCEDVYGQSIDFDQIEFGYNTTLLGIHEQLLHLQAVRH